MLPTLGQLINDLSISLGGQAKQVILYDRSMNEVVKYDTLSEIENKYKQELVKTVDYSQENPIIEIQMVNYVSR